jgi:RNA 2',3'-cyclic 3'-phosphodiesterase
MADQESKPRVRLFVALDLPDEVKAGIARWGERELRDPALRAVAEQSLHVTFAFLAHRPQAQVDEIAAVVAESGGPAATVELLNPQPRPLKGRARVYALPARSEGAEALQAGLRERLVAAGLYEAESRPFWPHVTVARVRAEGRGSRRPALVERPPKSLPQDLLQPFEAVRLSLYRSELQPRGARYVPLAQVALSAGSS